MYIIPEYAHHQLELARDTLTVIRDLAASAAGDRGITLTPEQLANLASLIGGQVSAALDAATWSAAPARK